MSKIILILLAVLVASTASSALSGQEALEPGDEVRVCVSGDTESWVSGAHRTGCRGGALVGALIGVAIPSNDWVGIDTIQVEPGVAPDGSQAISLSFKF